MSAERVKPTKNRNTMRKVKPCSGVNANSPVATEKLITVAINAGF